MLTSQDDYQKSKYKDLIKFECQHCHKEFTRPHKEVKYSLKIGENISYCSRDCNYKSRFNGETKPCSNCNNPVYRRPKDIKKLKSNRFFCCQSCAATYNNTHKTKGYRRSKLELYLETNLNQLFSDLIIKYNDKEAINSELDIFIPSLSLAIELNGIFHYEPIYGQDKLGKIQNNDNRKFQACLERNIELCIIDTSKLSYFKERTARPYLDIVVNLIKNKLVQTEGVEPSCLSAAD